MPGRVVFAVGAAKGLASDGSGLGATGNEHESDEQGGKYSKP
jgi:hypothetical protein